MLCLQFLVSPIRGSVERWESEHLEGVECIQRNANILLRVTDTCALAVCVCVCGRLILNISL